MASPLYNREILRLAASIPHQRRLERPQASVEKRSALCGSSIIVDVILDEEGRVSEIGQEVRACALGQASAAVMGTHAVGRTPEELGAARDALTQYLSGSRSDAGTWPGIEALGGARSYPSRHPAILLPFEAVSEAAARARS